MTQGLSGPGLGLPLPQNLYPTELFGAPYDTPSNQLTLAPGDSIVIPAGDWLIQPGLYSVLQYLNPITGVWSMGSSAAWWGGIHFVKGDGFNIRIANLLGCPVSATVAVAGSNYVQATTTISVTGGNSTWLPIVGGALAVSGATLVSSGAGYGVAPMVFIPPPPPAGNNPNGVGGISATGYCTIASGTVSGFTFTNPGAGYPSAPTPVIVPSPFDPNLSTGITAATLAFSLTNAGALTGALCTNSGAPLSTVTSITLTVGGAGSSGSLTANVMQTVTAASVSGVGAGYGTLAALLTTIGGVPAAGSIAQNPDSLGLAWRPRPAQIGLAPTGASGSLATQLGSIYDGGLFLTSATPNFVVQFQPLTATTAAFTAATIALTMGSRPDIVTIQPAP